MPASNLTLNPYQPIGLADSTPTESIRNPNVPCEVQVRRGILFRQFRLTGGLDTEIIWNARGTSEYVQVAGQRASSKTTLFYVPEFEFQIPTNLGRLSAKIEVRIDWLLWISGFRLSIEKERFYSEGSLRRHDPSDEGVGNLGK